MTTEQAKTYGKRTSSDIAKGLQDITDFLAKVRTAKNAPYVGYLMSVAIEARKQFKEVSV